MKPVLEIHNGIAVVRDDLFPGGTKARYFNNLFKTETDLVYPTSSCGGAQVALAHAAHKNGKRVHIFVTRRKQDHPRTQQAEALGAIIHRCANKNGGQVRLNVSMSRARKFAEANGYPLLKLGGDGCALLESIRKAALPLRDQWDEVWCAAGTGTLSRALQLAFPSARHYAVQLGQLMSDNKAGSATVMPYNKYPMWEPNRFAAPFPSCPHYDRKAWELCVEHTRSQNKRNKKVLFWNVLGDLST